MQLDGHLKSDSVPLKEKELRKYYSLINISSTRAARYKTEQIPIKHVKQLAFAGVRIEFVSYPQPRRCALFIFRSKFCIARADVRAGNGVGHVEETWRLTAPENQKPWIFIKSTKFMSRRSRGRRDVCCIGLSARKGIYPSPLLERMIHVCVGQTNPRGRLRVNTRRTIVSPAYAPIHPTYLLYRVSQPKEAAATLSRYTGELRELRFARGMLINNRFSEIFVYLSLYRHW